MQYPMAAKWAVAHFLPQIDLYMPFVVGQQALCIHHVTMMNVLYMPHALQSNIALLQYYVY